MAGASGPLGTSGSDMAGGLCRNWGYLAGKGSTGQGRWQEVGAGAGAGFSCPWRCPTPELSLQTLGLGHRAGPGVPEPTMSGCPSRGGRGGDQGLSASLRGPHFAPQGIFVKSLLARKEGTPASLVEPRRGLRSPKGPGTGEGRGGSAPTPIVQVEPPRWLGRAGLSNLLRVEPLGLSPLLGSSLRSLCGLS